MATELADFTSHLEEVVTADYHFPILHGDPLPLILLQELLSFSPVEPLVFEEILVEVFLLS